MNPEKMAQALRKAIEDGASDSVLVQMLVDFTAAEKERRLALVSAFQEYLYRTASQVPFEHMEWAHERGTALLEALKA